MRDISSAISCEISTDSLFLMRSVMDDEDTTVFACASIFSACCFEAWDADRAAAVMASNLSGCALQNSVATARSSLSLYASTEAPDPIERD
jgi:hypothetical protein